MTHDEIYCQFDLIGYSSESAYAKSDGQFLGSFDSPDAVSAYMSTHEDVIQGFCVIVQRDNEDGSEEVVS